MADLDNIFDDIFDFEKKENNHIVEALNEFINVGEGVLTEENLSKAQWIEKNRILRGENFSYTNADIKMDLSKHDKELKEAPRPYLMDYIEDECDEKTVIKCRQCLTGDIKVLFRNKRNKLKKIKIKKIFKNFEKYKNKDILIYDFDKCETVKSRIKKIWKTGDKECLSIKTYQGRRLKASLLERIYSCNKMDYVFAEYLCVDEVFLAHDKDCVLFDCVKEIKNIGFKETYDIEVENENHNFFANGILVSNSEFTENEFNLNLELTLRRPYTNVLHIFPTRKLAENIGKTKILAAVQSSPSIYEKVIKPLGSTLYRWINGSIYAVDGAGGSIGGRGGSYDKLTYDEYEKLTPTVEGVFNELISHSALKKITRISTPLFPGGGIDAKYNEGCQFNWWIICPECGHAQKMSFPTSIVNFFELEYMQMDSIEYLEKLDNVYLGCKLCKTYIDRTSRHYLVTSKWIANKPHLVGIKSSYRVTSFMLPWKTAKEILYKYHSSMFVHQFYNEVLGLAYRSEDATIDEAVFRQCEKHSLKNSSLPMQNLKRVSIGVDWGVVSWVVIRACGIPPETKKTHIVYVERIDKQSLIAHGYKGEQTDHVKRVEELAILFKAQIIINDANGIGVDRNSYLINKYPGKAFGCFYDTAEIVRQKMKSKVIEPLWTKDKVTVSRVGSFKLLLQEYMTRDENGKPYVYFPRIDNNVEEFVRHHLNIGIERMFDEKTGAVYEVVGSSGDDHLIHADNYSKIGFDYINRTSNKPLFNL